MSDPILFRPLSRDDFPLLEQWLQKPHIVAWWREPLDLAGIEAKYGPRVDGIEATHVFMIEHGRRPVGWIQWYRWSDYKDHAVQLDADMKSAGIDLSIGEEQMLGKGIGSEAIRQFIKQYVFVDPVIEAVVADPEENNLRSLRAFEKAGFTVTKKVELRGENYQRCVVRLPRDFAS